MEWTLREARRQKALHPTQIPEATRTITILGTQNEQEDGSIVWAVNNISYVPSKTPLLHAVKLGVKEVTDTFVSRENIPVVYNFTQTLDQAGIPRAAEKGTFVLKIAKDEVVDIILVNTVTLNGMMELHPWYVTSTLLVLLLYAFSQSHINGRNLTFVGFVHVFSVNLL